MLGIKGFTFGVCKDAEGLFLNLFIFFTSRNSLIGLAPYECLLCRYVLFRGRKKGYDRDHLRSDPW